MRKLVVDLPREEFEKIGASLVDALIQMNWANSKSQARRLIESGAIRINDEKVTDTSARLARFEGKDVIIVRKEDFQGEIIPRLTTSDE